MNGEQISSARKRPRKTSTNSPITRARMAAGMTQGQLAQAIGQTQNDVSRWERGMHQPRTDVLLKIAGVLGCSLEDLLDSDRSSPA